MKNLEGQWTPFQWWVETKDVDVDKVLALAPDLIVANQEENHVRLFEAIAMARCACLYSRFQDVLLRALPTSPKLSRLLSIEREPAVRQLIQKGYAITSGELPKIRASAFVPIWNDPLMTFSEDT